MAEQPEAAMTIAIAEADGSVQVSSSRILPLYSITKTYIAAAVFSLKIDIQSPISHWLDRSWVPRANQITVRQLLNHSSGLLIGSAADTVRFMRSRFIEPLRSEFVAVPGRQPGWQAPHSGYGLMAEPGQRYGHNGGGPGYSASCFHFIPSGRTACVLMPSAQTEAAMAHLMDVMREDAG